MDNKSAPVDPGIVCRDQLTTEVTLTGTYFSPIPVDVPNHPRIVLPSVTLTRTAELDGSAASESDHVLYSGDPVADPTNSFTEDGETPLLIWQSQEKMSLVVNQELTLADGRPGMLAEGIYDVMVTNPNAQFTESQGSLAIVDKPTLQKISPAIVCLEQENRTIEMTGQRLVRIGSAKAELKVEGLESTFVVALEGCTKIKHDGIDAEYCDAADVDLPRQSIEPGYTLLTLQNPETAACRSTDEIKLRVVPKPTINRVVPVLGCVAHGARTFEIQGAGFLRIDAASPSVLIGGKNVAVDSMLGCESLETMGSNVETCLGLTVTIEKDLLDPGLHDVTVTNPDPAGCAETAQGALRIAPPPTVTSAEPVLACVAQGSRQFVIYGSDFLDIGGTVSAVQIGELKLSATQVTSSNCSDLSTPGLTVKTCKELVVTVSQDALNAGLFDVTATNPDPAGCAHTAQGALRIVAAPTVTAAEPVLACVTQDSRQVIIRGSDFLQVENVLPAVKIGELSLSASLVTANNCSDLSVPGLAVKTCKELVLSVAQNALGTGLYDVSVTNPDPAGCSTTAQGALRIVPPPTVTAVEPVLVCVDQSERVVSVHGSDFLRIDGVVPAVTIGTLPLDAAQVAARGCTTLATTSGTVEKCDELIVTILEASLGNGLYDLTVANPAPAGCSATGSDLFRVVERPVITAVEPSLVCTADGSRQLVITGTGFLQIAGELPTVSFDSTEATVESATDCTAINMGTLTINQCSALTVSVAQGELSPGRPVVTVENPAPAGCSATSSTVLTVPPAVSITSVTPSNICASTGATQITIEGTGFLKIGSTNFELRIGGSVVTPDAISGCTSLVVEGMTAESCTTVTATVTPNSFDVGDVTISITNPTPSNCALTAPSVFRIVGPPQATGVTPTPICSNVLSNVTITGTDFATGAVVLAGTMAADSVTVNRATELVATFNQGLPAGTYPITVENGTGCGSTLLSALSVDPTPIVFFVDPPVIFNGVTIETTIFTTGLATNAQSVELTDAAGTASALTFGNPSRVNRIQATVPADVFAAGNYQVLVTSATGCIGTLPGGIAVTDTLTIGDLSIDPAFASQSQPTAVTIKVNTSTGSGFVSTPRVYLNPSTSGTAATAMKAVVMVDEATLTAVIPDGLAADTYDLIVVNPSGEVGLGQDAVAVGTTAPPVITSVLPESFIHNETVTATIRGEHFDTVGGVSVRLLCNGSVRTVDATGATTADAQTATTIFNIGSSGLASGDICQVELTNADGSSFAYSAISIRNNTENLNAWTLSTNLVEARRAPAVAAARPTATSRYLYAIGGDSGAINNARTIGTVKSTIEAANIGVYGEMGAWSIQRNNLPQARTWAGVAMIDRFIYLVGGHNGTSATNTLYRAQVLDPLAGPEILDLDAELGNGTSGLGGGLWIYRVAATYRDNDANNPNGESIPGEVLNVQLPDRPEKIKLKLMWSEVNGANGYRIYRSPSANRSVNALELVSEIDCGANSLCNCVNNPSQCQYWDNGATTNPAQTPLPPGSLGVWHAVTGSTLNISREAHASVAAPNFASAGQWFLYAFGGRGQNAAYLDSYEYATVTVAADGSQTVSAWTLVNASGQKLSSARAELGAFVITREDGEVVGPTEVWIYIGAGRTTNGNLSRNLDANLVGASGSLGTLTYLDTGDWPPFYAGYGYGAANNKLFMFGGKDGNASEGGISAMLCDTAGCLPDIQQLGKWNALGTGNNTRRQIYSGSAQESAFFFLVGGHNGTNALNTTEQTVQ